MTPTTGLYVHVPFCRHKCLYCDFYTGGERIADWDSYIRCVKNELKERKSELISPPSTLYIGGGTPSLVPEKNLEDLINFINNSFEKKDWKEFTLEVNPEDIDFFKVMAWKNVGVNRISIGIQSLNNKELQIIGRKHSGEKALKAIGLLKETFNNISVDLMFGIPGQTMDTYCETLNKIMELRPSHISTYSLMLEEGTAMTLLVKNHKIELPSEDEWLKMYEATLDKLKELGYLRYEISNYSLPGMESKHNSSYWEGAPYLGLGPGAHSFDGNNIRRANPNDIRGYLTRFRESRNGVNPFYNEEVLSDTESREEMIMTRLRTSKGLNIEEFGDRFGAKQKKYLLQKALKYISQGYLKEADCYLAFTEKGFIISNSIMADLI